jgi:hypothetical protein
MEGNFLTPLQLHLTAKSVSIKTIRIVRWHLIRRATAVTALKAVLDQQPVVPITQSHNSNIGFVHLQSLALLVELYLHQLMGLTSLTHS